MLLLLHPSVALKVTLASGRRITPHAAAAVHAPVLHSPYPCAPAALTRQGKGSPSASAPAAHTMPAKPEPSTLPCSAAAQAEGGTADEVG